MNLLATQSLITRLLALVMRSDEGQDTMEYGLLASLLSIAAVGVLVLVGPEIRTLYQAVVDALQSL